MQASDKGQEAGLPVADIGAWKRLRIDFDPAVCLTLQPPAVIDVYIAVPLRRETGVHQLLGYRHHLAFIRAYIERVVRIEAHRRCRSGAGHR